MKKIKDVVVLNNYRLLLTFDSKEQKIYDMSANLNGVFEYLKDYERFKKVRIVRGALTWFRDIPPNSNICNEIDICPDSAYLNSTPIEGIIN